MTSAREQHTVIPSGQTGPELERLAAVLGYNGELDKHATLTGPDGTEVPVPPEVYEALRDVVTAMAQGRAISIAPRNTVLTTQEAADMLNISRPTLVRLLEEGEIPFQRHGRHRKVRLTDVVDYQDRSRKERRAVLAEMTRAAGEDGTADTITEFVHTR